MSALLFPSVSSSSLSSSFFSIVSSSSPPPSGGLEGLQTLPPLLEGPVGQALGCLHSGLASSSLLPSSSSLLPLLFQNIDSLKTIKKLQNSYMHHKNLIFNCLSSFKKDLPVLGQPTTVILGTGKHGQAERSGAKLLWIRFQTQSYFRYQDVSRKWHQ